MEYSFEIPRTFINHSNSGEHWATRSTRVKLHYSLIAIYWLKGRVGKVNLPCSVYFVRKGPLKLDFDNLGSACKTLRDAIADKLVPGLKPGRADGDPRITWHYSQETAKKNSMLIRIVENQLDMFHEKGPISQNNAPLLDS
jgi:hypothetical protein